MFTVGFNQIFVNFLPPFGAATPLHLTLNETNWIGMFTAEKSLSLEALSQSHCTL